MAQVTPVPLVCVHTVDLRASLPRRRAFEQEATLKEITRRAGPAYADHFLRAARDQEVLTRADRLHRRSSIEGTLQAVQTRSVWGSDGYFWVRVAIIVNMVNSCLHAVVTVRTQLGLKERIGYEW